MPARIIRRRRTTPSERKRKAASIADYKRWKKSPASKRRSHSLKNPHLYDLLRKQGYPPTKAAMISNGVTKRRTASRHRRRR